MAKKIPVIDVTIDEKTTVPFYDFLKQVLNATPEKGFTIDIMRERMAVLAVIEQAEASGASEVILEDAHWRTLRAAFAGMSFARASQSILDLFDAISNAETVKITQA